MGLRLSACFDEDKAQLVVGISAGTLLAKIDIKTATFECTPERDVICITRDQYSEYSCEPQLVSSQLVYVYHSGRFHVTVTKSVRNLRRILRYFRITYH